MHIARAELTRSFLSKKAIVLIDCIKIEMIVSLVNSEEIDKGRRRIGIYWDRENFSPKWFRSNESARSLFFLRVSLLSLLTSNGEI